MKMKHLSKYIFTSSVILGGLQLFGQDPFYSININVFDSTQTRSLDNECLVLFNPTNKNGTNFHYKDRDSAFRFNTWGEYCGEELKMLIVFREKKAMIFSIYADPNKFISRNDSNCNWQSRFTLDVPFREGHFEPIKCVLQDDGYYIIDRNQMWNKRFCLIQQKE